MCMQSPFALATLSTVAAAINFSFDPFSLIFGPPYRALPCCPVCLGSRLIGR